MVHQSEKFSENNHIYNEEFFWKKCAHTNDLNGLGWPIKLKYLSRRGSLPRSWPTDKRETRRVTYSFMTILNRKYNLERSAVENHSEYILVVILMIQPVAITSIPHNATLPQQYWKYSLLSVYHSIQRKIMNKYSSSSVWRRDNVLYKAFSIISYRPLFVISSTKDTFLGN